VGLYFQLHFRYMESVLLAKMTCVSIEKFIQQTSTSPSSKILSRRRSEGESKGDVWRWAKPSIMHVSGLEKDVHKRGQSKHLKMQIPPRMLRV
jgi:hypothetical protein